MIDVGVWLVQRSQQVLDQPDAVGRGQSLHLFDDSFNSGVHFHIIS
jgi:hypothetical protein